MAPLHKFETGLTEIFVRCNQFELAALPIDQRLKRPGPSGTVNLKIRGPGLEIIRAEATSQAVRKRKGVQGNDRLSVASRSSLNDDFKQSGFAQHSSFGGANSVTLYLDEKVSHG